MDFLVSREGIDISVVNIIHTLFGSFIGNISMMKFFSARWLMLGRCCETTSTNDGSQPVWALKTVSRSVACFSDATTCSNSLSLVGQNIPIDRRGASGSMAGMRELIPMKLLRRGKRTSVSDLRPVGVLSGGE